MPLLARHRRPGRGPHGPGDGRGGGGGGDVVAGDGGGRAVEVAVQVVMEVVEVVGVGEQVAVVAAGPIEGGGRGGGGV